ncbi:conserved protein, unknown function, partial [Hepatocystis sp. ex Piliocolobus tephrosceles]
IKRLKKKKIISNTFFFVENRHIVQERVTFTGTRNLNEYNKSTDRTSHIIRKDSNDTNGIIEEKYFAQVETPMELNHNTDDMLSRYEDINNMSKTFLQTIYSIFNLLKEENNYFLDCYNLENYTRIFIYDCEKLKRSMFIHFLKKINNFYFKIINLNTMFGTYFSETEQNFIRIFKKCHKIINNSNKNVCLVIDGIDIIKNNIPMDKTYTDKFNEYNIGDNCY